MDNSTTIPGIKKELQPVKIFVIILILCGLGLFPFISDNRFYISMINEMMIYGLLALSLDVLLGYTGLLSFMHNAYLGISAYTVGLHDHSKGDVVAGFESFSQVRRLVYGNAWGHVVNSHTGVILTINIVAVLRNLIVFTSELEQSVSLR